MRQLKMRYILGVILLLTINLAKANIIYSPGEGAAYLPNINFSFPSLLITDNILQDNGDGNFSFSEYSVGSPSAFPFFKLTGTLFMQNGQVERWDITQSSGSRYYSQVAITRYDGVSFFESLEVKEGVCCVTPEGPSYSQNIGTWSVSNVPLPASLPLFLAGFMVIAFRQIRQQVCG
jgi:hypothetical protein